MAVAEIAFAAFAAKWLAFRWIGQTANTNAALRGLSAVSSQVAWASGTGGTYLRTTDGGVHWQTGQVAGGEELDFRDIEALDSDTAYAMSSGDGQKSKLFRTSDGGVHWTLTFTNPDKRGFFDAVKFWDRQHGIVLGDPVEGHFALFTTRDGGMHWQRQVTPAAMPDEGAFAASGTALAIEGASDAWFGTGGRGGGRVFHSADRGRSWTVTRTKIRSDSKSAGIFSLVFRDAKHGTAVGGDYMKPDDMKGTTAMTKYGGRTWVSPRDGRATGYRSGVAALGESIWIAVGTSGSDVSEDDGRTWRRFSAENLNAVCVAKDGAVWAAGPQGKIAKLIESRRTPVS